MRARNVTTRLPRILLGIIAALALSSCADPPEQDVGIATTAPQPPPLPQYYGLYAVDQGGLVRIGGSAGLELQNWSSQQDLGPDTTFIVYSRDLAAANEPLEQEVVLDRVAKVRDERTPDGSVIPTPDAWAAPDLPGYSVPLQYAPVQDHPDMIIAAPVSPLTPGLYSLKLRGTDAWNSRFGVAWSSVPAEQYASQYCVEQLPSGYQPCSAAGATGAAAGGGTDAGVGFAVRALHSSVTHDGGVPGLVIEGELVNTSSENEILPALSASLLDNQDQVVQVLPSLTLPEQALESGGVYDFRINVTNPAPGAARVRVTPNA